MANQSVTSSDLIVLLECLTMDRDLAQTIVVPNVGRFGRMAGQRHARSLIDSNDQRAGIGVEPRTLKQRYRKNLI